MILGLLVSRLSTSGLHQGSLSALTRITQSLLRQTSHNQEFALGSSDQGWQLLPARGYSSASAPQGGPPTKMDMGGAGGSESTSQPTQAPSDTPAAPAKPSTFPSAQDDKFGVQKNWFNALYKQLNLISRTGNFPGFKGRQRAVFEQVESEFEALYNKYVKDKGLDSQAHRSLLMCCLSVATYRVINEELGDTKLVREIIRANLGAVMLSILLPVHRFKLWFSKTLLSEDMYAQAIQFLPALQKDMGSLCSSSVDEESEGVTVMTTEKCLYYDLLVQEDTPFLLTEFCCHHSLIWLHEFRKYNVVVSMDECKAWDDRCCKLRVARPGKAGQDIPVAQCSAEQDINAAASPGGPSSPSKSRV